ncbi:MAG: hypothetical protein AAB227_08110 [Pseudomonadota bacterium]
MPTDTETDAIEPLPESPAASTETSVAAVSGERLPHPPRVRRFRTPKVLRSAERSLLRWQTRLIERLAANPVRRRRSSIAGAVLLNMALISVLAVYGRVRIYVPNKPAESISVVFVDLPANPPVVDLRDPEIAPEPEPEPVKEPELMPEPEPAPKPEPEPPVQPEPEPKPEPEPALDLTPEPAFARPSEVENAPFIPDQAPAPAPPTLDEPLPGDIEVDGDQAPTETEQPLVSVEPEAKQKEAEEDSGDEDEKGDEVGAGEVAAGEKEDREQAPVAEIAPAPAVKPATGDDMFDEEPVFNGRRLALPSVNLPKGDTSAVPGTSGVVAIYCPEEFKDKEKIAECAGRPEIRSGWRPGSSGEDFSKAAAVLKDRKQHGDFSNDAVTFGPEIARQIEQRRRTEDLEDFRKKQDLGNAGIASDPAAGTRPDLAPPIDDPSWTRRDDPLVNQKDVEKLRKELEEAEKKKSPQ